MLVNSTLREIQHTSARPINKTRYGFLDNFLNIFISPYKINIFYRRIQIFICTLSAIIFATTVKAILQQWQLDCIQKGPPIFRFYRKITVSRSFFRIYNDCFASFKYKGLRRIPHTSFFQYNTLPYVRQVQG